MRISERALVVLLIASVLGFDFPDYLFTSELLQSRHRQCAAPVSPAHCAYDICAYCRVGTWCR